MKKVTYNVIETTLRSKTIEVEDDLVGDNVHIERQAKLAADLHGWDVIEDMNQDKWCIVHDDEEPRPRNPFND